MTEPDLRALARRIPLVGDRALAEIVNGLATVDAMNQSRTGEGFFRRLLTGGSTDRRRGIEASTAIATVQRHLVSWVREVSDHLAYTDLTVGLLATEVEELQHDVAHAKAMSGQALAEIRELAGLLAEFINATDHRFAEIDRRLDSHEQVIDAHAKAILLLDRRVLATELWQSAWAETDLTVRSWRHEGIYSGLPWLCQVLLLARQTAAGGPGLHDFAVGDRGWRNRLADDILSDPRTASAQRQFSAHGTRTIRRLVGDVLDELADPVERRMVAELLGIGLPAQLRPPHRPISFAVAHGLELGAREPHTPHAELARRAISRADEDYGHLPDYVTCKEFVHRVIGEQADAAHQARANLRKEQQRSRAETADDPAERRAGVSRA